MRYISCTGAKVGSGGHGGRILRSERDLQSGESDRTVYGMKGDEGGLTCFFNVEP